jgi:hypothetical protein
MSGLFGGGTTINNEQAHVGSLRVQTSSEGVSIPLVYGLARMSPNLLWYDDFKAIPHTTSQESGKGGGSTVNNTTYTYTAAVMMGLGEGPVGLNDEGQSVIKTVWKNKDIISGGDRFTKLNYQEKRGTSSNSSWGYMATNYPAKSFQHHFQAYVGFQPLDLGASDSLPNLSFEIYGRSVSNRSVSDLYPDLNPAMIIKDFLTSTTGGAGFPSASLGDLEVFRTYAEASFFMAAPVYQESTPAAEMLDKLCKLSNVAPFWSEGLLKFVPFGDQNVSHTDNSSVTWNYTANLTPRFLLGPDDFLAEVGEDPVKVRRRRSSDAFNSIRIECLDRWAGYNARIVEAKDLASITVLGYRPADVLEAHEICSPEVAQRMAQVMLQREVYLRNEYEFKLGWRYSQLEQMDIVSLTEPLLGLAGKLVRLTKTTDDAEEGGITCLAEEVLAGLSTGKDFGVAPTDKFVKTQNFAPGTANSVVFQPPLSMSGGTPQIWVGAWGNGSVTTWGGAEVWFSDDNTTFARIGEVTMHARAGFLSANLAAGSDPSTVTISVDLTDSRSALTSGAQALADAGDTACVILSNIATPEIIDYTTATLTATYKYNLTTYLRRGQQCSYSQAHLSGVKFMRLDEAVQKFDIDASRVGKTVYFKLVSYNTTGGGLQDIAGVSSQSYVVQPLGIEVVAGLVPLTVETGEQLCVESAASAPGGRWTVRGRVQMNKAAARVYVYSL